MITSNYRSWILLWGSHAKHTSVIRLISKTPSSKWKGRIQMWESNRNRTCWSSAPHAWELSFIL